MSRVLFKNKQLCGSILSPAPTNTTAERRVFQSCPKGLSTRLRAHTESGSQLAQC